MVRSWGKKLWERSDHQPRAAMLTSSLASDARTPGEVEKPVLLN